MQSSIIVILGLVALEILRFYPRPKIVEKQQGGHTNQGILDRETCRRTELMVSVAYRSSLEVFVVFFEAENP